jgi:hypothetical protein
VRLRKLWFPGFVLLLVALVVVDGSVNVEMRTDEDEYAVGEAVTTSFVVVNKLPIPVPVSAVARIDFGFILDGEPTGAVESAHLTPAGGMMLLEPGGVAWLNPMKITSEEPGELVVYVEIESPDGYEKTYSKTVTIRNPS